MGSELNSGLHLEAGEGRGQEPSRETKKKWPERREGTRESREKGVLRKRAWPAAESAAEKPGVSLVRWGGGGQAPGVCPRADGPILGGVQARAAASHSALGQVCWPGKQLANLC